MPFYGGLGISCHATSSRVKAKGVTSGIADVICFWERLGFQFFHETKMPGRRQTLEQHQFEADCMATGVPYILGGVDEAIAFVIHMGIAEPAGVTIRVKPRDKWPSKPRDIEMLREGWKWAVARHDATAKFGYKGGGNV